MAHQFLKHFLSLFVKLPCQVISHHLTTTEQAILVAHFFWLVKLVGYLFLVFGSIFAEIVYS